MERRLVLVLTIVISLLIVSCQYGDDFFADESKMQMLSFVKEEESNVLIWQDKEYQPYKPADTRLRGEGFGIVENQADMRVYFCNEQKPEEWLVLCVSTFMEGYVLYKENSVTEIPG